MRSTEKDSSEYCKRQHCNGSTDIKPLLLLLQQRMQNLHLCPDWDGTGGRWLQAKSSVCSQESNLI